MADDKLVYFNIRARGEAIRMLYTAAGKPFVDDRVKFADWPARKKEMPTGQIPILVTSEGELNLSNTIARYVAKKLGLVGSGLWEEAVHDMVMENGQELMDSVIKIYKYKKFGSPKPDDSDKIEKDVHEKLVTVLTHVQKIAESRGKQFIVNDQIGLADVYLYASLEFMQFAFPDIMSTTDWTKAWSEKVRNHDKLKSYIDTRPSSDNGL